MTIALKAAIFAVSGFSAWFTLLEAQTDENLAMDEKKKSIALYLFYLIVALLVASSAVLILPVYREYRKRQDVLFRLKEQMAMKTATCIKLNQGVNDLKSSSAAIEKIAREKFSLCREGETIMRYRASELNGSSENRGR